MAAPSTHHHGAALTVQSKRGGVAAMQLHSAVVREMTGRRLLGAEFPNSDAEPLRLVSEVVLDSRAREMHDADRQQFEHGVVALEGRCLGMLGPVRLEGDLWHLAGGRPF